MCQVQEECKSRPLILIGGFIHDISSFLDHHPGGKHQLLASAGKETTAAFFGGVYSHSNAAHNVRSVSDCNADFHHLTLAQAFIHDARGCAGRRNGNTSAF